MSPSPSRTGQGLNSIRWRFALAAAVLALVGSVARDAWLGRSIAADAASLASLLLPVLLAATVTFWMASRMTGLIGALKRSTEAIAAGDYDATVDVDCACEIGGLADSFRQMTQRLNANVLRINTLAYTDAITGLPNRAVVDHLLAQAMQPGTAEPFHGAILFIDLDGFKRINDTLGHDAGDELLRQASQRLLREGLDRTPETIDRCTDVAGMPCNRAPRDTVFARWAGDEFVAVLPGLTERTALALVGERLVKALQAPFRIKGQEVVIGASVGIATTPQDTQSAAELLIFADLAMYSAKQAGKARCRFFDHELRAQMLADDRTEAELRQALQRGELLLHFQPTLHLGAPGELTSTETLVRWQHPRRGLLYPADFIDLAERAGLMAALGRQVLDLALAQARRWLDQGLEWPVAVNVSPSQFTEPAFVAQVLEALARHRVPAGLLIVEITESVAMTNFAASVDRLSRLRAAGVRIALDDFGIGYSNLSQLARLPLDAIKIDRSLVSGIGRAPKSEAIIRAIVGMAHALSCRTVAEGIESPLQRDFLQALGCHCGQGFLLARPMAGNQVVTWASRDALAVPH